jgi:hypothetical protein
MILGSNIRPDITLSDIRQMSILISGLTSEMNIWKIQISTQPLVCTGHKGQGCEFIFGRTSWNISYFNCWWFALTMRGLGQSHIARSCCLISVKPQIVPISLILSIAKKNLWNISHFYSIILLQPQNINYTKVKSIWNWPWLDIMEVCSYQAPIIMHIHDMLLTTGGGGLGTWCSFCG